LSTDLGIILYKYYEFNDYTNMNLNEYIIIKVKLVILCTLLYFLIYANKYPVIYI